ncbi:MAG: glutaminyl-peptide cyclotransferase [Deltaproteobacteria bacterium]|jgi:glutamine cyclotransferase|nr:glutaminyl-peptide cyclotransferase [Deltaproteobacteria bacterium]
MSLKLTTSRILLLLCLGFSFLALQFSAEIVPAQTAPTVTAPIVAITVEKEVERPQNLFTQGLIFYNQHLYESTGRYNQSALYAYPASELLQKGGLGTVAKLNLPDSVFAEGLAQALGELYLLTWQEGLIYVIDPGDLTIKRSFHQPIIGWGLAFDGQNLWRSDGTDRLQKHKVGDFSPIGEPLEVRDGQNPVKDLNELEWDPGSGLLLANIWHSDLVAAIDLKSGQVKYYLDLSLISQKERSQNGHNSEAVANGLAFDSQGQLWVTGKLWPRIYRISYTAP